MEKIRHALREAKAKGFTVIVAGDEEGNNWNELNPEVLYFGDTKEKFIAMSVWRSIEEEDAFEDIECLHESTHSTSRGVFCADCGKELQAN